MKAALARAPRRLADAWFAPAPAERLAALRIGVGLYCLVFLAARGLHLWDLAAMPRRDFVPVGLARLLDGPLAPAVHHALIVVTAALAVTFTLGLWHRWLGPAFALAALWLFGYRSSWGMLFHTEHLVVLHAAVLALSPAADAWSLDARRRPSPPPPSEAYGWPLKLMAALSCLTYLVAGVAKVRLGGWGWAHGHQLEEQVAIDNVRKALLGSTMSPLAAPVLAHAWLFTPLAVATLIIELGAPLALLHRRVAAAWAVAAWGFHAGVVALMAIVFPYPLCGLAYAPLFAVERPFGWAGRRLRRLFGSPRSAQSSPGAAAST